MKKSYLFIAAAALFAACSSDSLTVENDSPKNPAAAEQAVNFGAYVNRGTTRAGYEGTLDNAALQTNGTGKANGFGVFSFYTNNEGYSETAIPDFFYNQRVYYSSGWTYAPVKYWPNEFGTEAASERVDYLTFFAYAPYVDSDSKTGKVAKTSDETGIIGMTRNTTLGDPLVKYAVNFDPAKCVDLCWGVAAEDFTETVTSSAPKNDIKKGKPFIDVIKPQIDSRIKFDFKHALTQLNVQIDADVDVLSHNDGDLNSNTRIYVRSISFEGFTDKGALNLNSEYTGLKTTPTWYDFTGNGNLSTKAVTIYDGRYDGREGVVSVNAPSELPLGLNPSIIQNAPYEVTASAITTPAATDGVTHTEKNVFNGAAATTPILVIPNGQPMKVTVVYDVETYDPSLAKFLSDGKTHGSTIENAITKPIQLASGADMILEAGKNYTIKLHLGMTSVKFDASVSDWDVSADEGKSDLPINNDGTILVAGGSTTTNVTSTGGNFTYTFSGAEGAITLKSSTPTGVTMASYSGENFTLSVPENATINNRSFTVVVKDATDPTPQEATVIINQAAPALVLNTITISNGTSNFDIINSSPTSITSAEWGAANIKIEKKVSGSADTTYADESFTRTHADNKVTINLSTAPETGKTYRITIKVGDTEAVTTVVPVS